ncbi:MAG: Protein yciE [Verrucomicrobiales bacterium]|nr:Protein yciE [Verrucomicrobiales bacterium]
MKQRDELISWLNDAYAMELSNMKILEAHIDDMDAFPEIKARLQQHLGETRQHAERMKKCIESIGAKVSRSKVGFGKVLGMLQGRSSSLFNDEVVKDVLSESATEHFEVASYRSLIAAAEQLGETRVIEACQQNMQEDMAMADWVDGQVPALTRRFMDTQLAE